MTATSLAAPLPEIVRAGRHDRTAIRMDVLTKRFPIRRTVREMLRRSSQRQHLTAVDGVTLDVDAGEVFGLLGPNGAGKTTLLKMLATLVLPDAGSAAVEGLDVVRDAARVRRVVTPVIADERSLNWRLTARENLELYAALLEVPRREWRARIDALLGDVGLERAGSRLVNALSSGMRQRLLIARALLARPRVLLLDEPTRSLDPITARAFRTLLREELVGRRGCTILLATHNTEEAFELCDRVAVLHQGRIVACGPARGLAARVGERRYRVWTTAPSHPAFRTLIARGLARDFALLPESEDGWHLVEIEGAPATTAVAAADHAAAILAALSQAGVSVARFESRPIALADLLERLIGSETA
jgi:ABC-type multidrug transport system ATPase subunit